MKRRIPETVRQFVAQRAGYRCEYCRVHQDDLFIGFEIDHIAGIQHGGGDEPANLAFACPHCNQHKGSDLTTFLDSYEDIVVLFNPRTMVWDEHFGVSNGEVLPKSKSGQATIKLLRFNDPERLTHRQLLMETGQYP